VATGLYLFTLAPDGAGPLAGLGDLGFTLGIGPLLVFRLALLHGGQLLRRKLPALEGLLVAGRAGLCLKGNAIMAA